VQGILLSPAEIAALPASGTEWTAIADRYAAPYGGAYAMGIRDDSNKDALVAALYGARMSDSTAKGTARDMINTMMGNGRDDTDVLATLRNISAYILAADLIDLATFDATTDAAFRSWLTTELSHPYTGGGGGGSILSIADYKANNFGTHANCDRLIAGLYLDDPTMYTDARNVWYGWLTGDPAFIPDPRNWTGTNWQADYLGTARYGINPAGATRDTHDFGGIIPEDMTRQGEYTGAWPPYTGSWPPPTGGGQNYIHGATDGATLACWIMHRQGEDAWNWGDQAMLRQMQFKYSVSQTPYSGFMWQTSVINNVYGQTFADVDPTATSTNVGYGAWWSM
jgi:hypothetical protein